MGENEMWLLNKTNYWQWNEVHRPIISITLSHLDM